MNWKGIRPLIFSKVRRVTCYAEVYNHHHYHNNLFLHSFTTFTTQTEAHPFEQIACNSFHQFNKAFHDCTANGDLRMGRMAHAQLIRLQANGSASLWNKLLSLYCKCTPIQLCRQLFDTMFERDVVSFNIMISMYVRHAYNADGVLSLYVRMQREGVNPNHITFCTLIGGCVGVKGSNWIELIHGQLIQYGFNSNGFVGGSLVDAYSKRMRLEDAIRAFDEIVEVDLVSWNIMMDGCARNGSKQHAMTMFSRMRRDGLPFDSFTMSSITKTCSKPKDLEWGMQLHCCMVKAGLTCETPIGNSLITMYSKCEEGMLSANNVFETILDPNIISWTAMIAGFMQNGQNAEAVGFYRRMLRVGVKENDFSFASILPAYTSLASLEQGMQVHARIVKSVFGLDVSVRNALIDMYSKCGSLRDAKLVFATMEIRDVVSWTVMITALGQHGSGKEALDVLKAMKSEGMKPDAVTFLGALSACSHGGLVDEGIQVFRSMMDVNRVRPRREHYACVVDMFGRAGRLNEAENFIAERRIASDVLVWEALLGACRIHGEMELGERSAKQIMQLEPKKDGAYVLLANIYADKGLWEDKGKVREKLSVGGLNKEAGSSWVA